jgi:hypothetical protein
LFLFLVVGFHLQRTTGPLLFVTPPAGFSSMTGPRGLVDGPVLVVPPDEGPPFVVLPPDEEPPLAPPVVVPGFRVGVAVGVDVLVGVGEGGFVVGVLVGVLV